MKIKITNGVTVSRDSIVYDANTGNLLIVTSVDWSGDTGTAEYFDHSSDFDSVARRTGLFDEEEVREMEDGGMTREDAEEEHLNRLFMSMASIRIIGED